MEREKQIQSAVDIWHLTVVTWNMYWIYISLLFSKKSWNMYWSEFIEDLYEKFSTSNVFGKENRKTAARTPRYSRHWRIPSSPIVEKMCISLCKFFITWNMYWIYIYIYIYIFHYCFQKSREIWIEVNSSRIYVKNVQQVMLFVLIFKTKKLQRERFEKVFGNSGRVRTIAAA